jgi:Na+/proline symporter
VFDILIVLAYLILLLAIGIWKRPDKSGFAGFAGFAGISGKGNTSKLLLVATIFASTIGGGTTFGISEKAFEGNIAYSYGLFFAIPIDILIAVYLVPRLIKHYGAESIGDIMHVYYGSTGRYISGFSAIMVSVGLVAAQISVSGRIFEYILQVNYVEGVILSYGIVIIYTTVGGLRSVLFTNQLQFFAMLVAIPIISIFGLYEVGIFNFIQLVPAEKLSFINNQTLVTSTVMATLGFMVMNLFPNFIQRTLINKNPGETTKAIYIKSFIYAIFLVFVTLNGLLAFIIYPEQKASLALPFLIDHIIPAGLQGLVVVGLLATVTSTADSDLNVTSVTIVKDFLSPIFNIKNQKRLLLIARIANVFIGSFAIIIALSFSAVVDLVIYISGFWGPVVLVPFVFALFEITIPTRMMAFSCFVGAISFVLWERYFGGPLMPKGVFIGVVANLTIFLISRFFSRYNYSDIKSNIKRN